MWISVTHKLTLLGCWAGLQKLWQVWSGLLKGLYLDWKSLPYMLGIPFSRQPLLMQVFVPALSRHQYDCQLPAGFDCRHLLSVPYFHFVKEVLRPSEIPPLYYWLVGCMELSSHSKIFHSYGDVTIAGEGLQILTYARHLGPLSSEGSLTFHTHCDTGLPFIMVISEDPWHSYLMPSVWQWSCHY